MSNPKIPSELDIALFKRYGPRPEKLAEVRANARAWEQLKGGRPVSPPSTEVDELDLGPHGGKPDEPDRPLTIPQTGHR